LKAFASEYFSTEEYERVEWIDDTSANLVYRTPEIALEALAAFSVVEFSDVERLPQLQLIPARPFPAHPETKLEVRLSVSSDRKQAGARERSRFYLFNPEYDPGERRKRESYGRRSQKGYRDRDDSSYYQRRRDDFDASLYDDSDVTRTLRTSSLHGRLESKSSVSSEEHGGEIVRKARPRGIGRELFPDRVDGKGHRRFRDRSASPTRDSDGDHTTEGHLTEQSRLRTTAMSGKANRLHAQTIKARLSKMESKPKELFPQKLSTSHHHSSAPDAADTAADLFASRMTVPFVDGSSDASSGTRDLTSRINRQTSENCVSAPNAGDHIGYSIRGIAKQQQATEISIKGIATTPTASVKELFPNKLGLNSGKELFSEKLEGRGRRRQRAEDMFY
jgi:Nuclear cap-binding protein subunit 3